MMDKGLKGAGIGFLVGGGLGYVVAACAYGSSDNEDVSNYAFLYGIAFGSFAAIIGGMIGLLIGAALERKR
jgi:ABC-type antimicrobial peptide transport system permease subunit